MVFCFRVKVLSLSNKIYIINNLVVWIFSFDD